MRQSMRMMRRESGFPIWTESTKHCKQEKNTHRLQPGQLCLGLFQQYTVVFILCNDNGHTELSMASNRGNLLIWTSTTVNSLTCKLIKMDQWGYWNGTVPSILYSIYTTEYLYIHTNIYIPTRRQYITPKRGIYSIVETNHNYFRIFGNRSNGLRVFDWKSYFIRWYFILYKDIDIWLF